MIIVVAIIGILAAIAILNYLDFQARAKDTGAISSLGMIHLALEAFRTFAVTSQFPVATKTIYDDALKDSHGASTFVSDYIASWKKISGNLNSTIPHYFEYWSASERLIERGLSKSGKWFTVTATSQSW